jgi:hypothetical protein
MRDASFHPSNYDPVIDEKLTPSTEVDLFRVKIWDKTNDDAVVYDNNIGNDDDVGPTTQIGGGQIVIHKKINVIYDVGFEYRRIHIPIFFLFLILQPHILRE